MYFYNILLFIKNNFENTVQEIIENNYRYNFNSYDIKFNIEKKLNKYIKKIFLYRNDQYQYVKTLKKILILLIENKKHKNLVKRCYETVDSYIDNFKINDTEYNNLVKFYKS